MPNNYQYMKNPNLIVQISIDTTCGALATCKAILQFWQGILRKCHLLSKIVYGVHNKLFCPLDVNSCECLVRQTIWPWPLVMTILTCSCDWWKLIRIKTHKMQGSLSSLLIGCSMFDYWWAFFTECIDFFYNFYLFFSIFLKFFFTFLTFVVTFA